MVFFRFASSPCHYIHIDELIMSTTPPSASDNNSTRDTEIDPPDLPNELKLLILDTVRDSGDRSTLSILARTGRLLHDRATAALYSIASIGHDDILRTEDIANITAHPLRSHPYLKWADDMEGIDKRRQLLRGRLTFITETYPASSIVAGNGTTHFNVNHCKCCYTGPARSADMTSASLLRNQLSNKLPLTKLCEVYYRSARAPEQSGSCFSNEIMCMLTEHIKADSYLYVINPLDDRWRSTFVFATPTRIDIPPEDGSNPLSHRILHRLNSGELYAGFLPAKPCEIQDEASLPGHRADRLADIRQAARFLFRHVAGVGTEATAVSHRTTFLFADDPCTHKSITERSDVRGHTAFRLDARGFVGLASNVKVEDLESHPEITRVLPGGQ